MPDTPYRPDPDRTLTFWEWLKWLHETPAPPTLGPRGTLIAIHTVDETNAHENSRMVDELEKANGARRQPAQEPNA